MHSRIGYKIKTKIVTSSSAIDNSKLLIEKIIKQRGKPKIIKEKDIFVFKKK